MRNDLFSIYCAPSGLGLKRCVHLIGLSPYDERSCPFRASCLRSEHIKNQKGSSLSSIKEVGSKTLKGFNLLSMSVACQGYSREAVIP